MLYWKRKGTEAFACLFVFLLLLLLCFLTCLGVTDMAAALVSAGVIGTGSGLVLLVLWRMADGIQAAIICAGYLLRCACLWVDLYGRDVLTLMHSGGDSESFARDAAELYRGLGPEAVSTKYPYLISGIYRMTGENRFCAQYVNIVFWVLGAGILLRICRRFQVKNSACQAIGAVWALLPTGVILSSILLRESAEMFFGMWSFERFLIWMQTGRWKYCLQAWICVVPAIILHSASVALWVAYVAVMMFWDAREQRYRWQLRTGAVSVISLAGLWLVSKTPLRPLFFAYLGVEWNLYDITHKFFVQGGSDYLVSMDCQSWGQFVPYTLLRMFYFLFSPLPPDARGFRDLVMFAMDGLPLAAVIVWSLVQSGRKRQIRRYTYAALAGGAAFAGIFAWGVRNAGTALRHRYLAWSIFIIALGISCGHLDQKKERL